VTYNWRGSSAADNLSLSIFALYENSRDVRTFSYTR
jgi:hypothetical protein